MKTSNSPRTLFMLLISVLLQAGSAHARADAVALSELGSGFHETSSYEACANAMDAALRQPAWKCGVVGGSLMEANTPACTTSLTAEGYYASVTRNFYCIVN